MKLLIGVSFMQVKYEERGISTGPAGIKTEEALRIYVVGNLLLAYCKHP